MIQAAQGSMERAELFNSCFAKAFSPNLQASVEPQTDKVDSAIESNFDPVTVKNRLTALSASIATGPDDFCNTLLRGAVDGLTLPLSLIFHRGYQEGIVRAS